VPKAQALQRGGARDGGATGGFHRVLQLRWVPGAGRWMEIFPETKPTMEGVVIGKSSEHMEKYGGKCLINVGKS